MDKPARKRKTIWFPPRVEAALNRRIGEHRSLNFQVVDYVVEGLKRDGYLNDPCPGDKTDG